MSLFKTIHFLQDQQARDPRRSDASRYAHGYGNRVASAETFAPFGHRRASPIEAGRATCCVALPCTAACG